MKGGLVLMSVSFWVLCGAAGCPPPSPTPPTPDADSGSVVDASVMDAVPPSPNDACSAAEANLLALGCKDSRGRLLGGPNLHGVPWAQICRENAANGVDMKPTCIVAKTSCAGVFACR